MKGLQVDWADVEDFLWVEGQIGTRMTTMAMTWTGR